MPPEEQQGANIYMRQPLALLPQNVLCSPQSNKGLLIFFFSVEGLPHSLPCV